MAVVYVQCERWTSYDMIKHHMITTDIISKQLQRQGGIRFVKNKLIKCNQQAFYYFQIKVIIFPGQNRKLFKEWRVVATKEVFLDYRLFLSIFTFFPARCEMPKCSRIRTLKWRLVLPYQVVLQPPHLYLLTRPKSNILGNLSLKVKKLLTLTGDVKTIFKLQDVNLSLNNL